MKRNQYRIEVSGRMVATKDQVDAVVKALTSSLAGVDARGGLTKVEIEVQMERKVAVRKKKNALTPTPLPRTGEGSDVQGELKPN